MPSQTLAALCGSRISAAHLPHGLCLTPLYLLLRSPPLVSSYDTPLLLLSDDGVVGIVAVVVVVAVVAGAAILLVGSSVTFNMMRRVL